MVGLLLRSAVDSTPSFFVTTYHMPCQFYCPAAMSIHLAIYLQTIQNMTDGKHPVIIGGDFNFSPKSPQYEFATTGILPAVVNNVSDPATHGQSAIPKEPLYPGDPFTFTLKHGALKSAYSAIGKEPDFTNYAANPRSETAFSATLDYLFFQGGKNAKITCLNVDDIQNTCANIARTLESLPGEGECSDHLLIAAEFQIQETM
jgi:hypothetical protein